MKNTTANRRATILSLIACAAATAAITGCTHSSWPPIEESERNSSLSQINNAPTPQVIGEALSLVTLRYPPVSNAERGQVYDTPFAFSLPSGADADAYDAVARRVQRGAQPATDANANLTTYIVSRVIVRGVTAEVDVLRPVPDLGTDAQGKVRYQGVTVYLTGSLGSWKAGKHHTFPVGMFDVPERTTKPEVLPTWGAGAVENAG